MSLLAFGTMLTAGGLYGLHLAGRFWTLSHITNACERGLAISLPAIALLMGAFVTSYVLLAGPLLSCLKPRTRLVIHTVYACAVIVICFAVSHAAGRIAAG